MDCVEEEASWAEAARWWCALAARGGDPGIRTSEGGSANGVGVVRDLTVVLCRVRASDGSVARPPERFDADEILRRFCRDPPPPASEMARHRGVRGGGGARFDAGRESRDVPRRRRLGRHGRGRRLGDDDGGAMTDPPHWFRGHGFDPAHGIQNVASAIDALATLPLRSVPAVPRDVGSDVAEVFKEVAGPDGCGADRGKTMRRSTFDASASDSPEPGGVGGVSGREARKAGRRVRVRVRRAGASRPRRRFIFRRAGAGRSAGGG